MSSFSLDPVIFLDVDGVLALERSQTLDFEDGDPTLLFDESCLVPLERACVRELARLAATARARVVVSSTWRLVPAPCDRAEYAGVNAFKGAFYLQLRDGSGVLSYARRAPLAAPDAPERQALLMITLGLIFCSAGPTLSMSSSTAFGLGT